jgi:hypothetical protein
MTVCASASSDKVTKPCEDHPTPSHFLEEARRVFRAPAKRIVRTEKLIAGTRRGQPCYSRDKCDRPSERQTSIPRISLGIALALCHLNQSTIAEKQRRKYL